MVLGADILYFQSKEDVVKLVATMDGLLAAGGAVLLAYEWREDWETTDAFHCECAARGHVEGGYVVPTCDSKKMPRQRGAARPSERA